MTKYKVARCPYCRENLDRITIEVMHIFEFNPQTGRYDKIDEIWGEFSMEHCNYCDEDLIDIMPEGVFEYQAEKIKEAKD